MRSTGVTRTTLLAILIGSLALVIIASVWATP